MTSTSQLRRSVQTRLEAAGVDSASAEAGWIVATALGVSPAQLPLTEGPSAAQVAHVERMTVRRQSREPLQHILGWAGFRHLTLDVGPGVFIPRPETEVLVEVSLAALRARAAEDADDRAGAPPVVVDLCSGSGAVALALATEFPGVQAYAVELAAPAYRWLARNVDNHHAHLRGQGSRVIALHGDACGDPLPQLRGQVDLVATNPPYIPNDCVPRDPEVARHDPPTALYGGSDGLHVVRRLATTAAGHLRPGGTFAVEHGDAQGDSHPEGGVPEILRSSGFFTEVVDVADLNGRPRVTVGRRLP